MTTIACDGRSMAGDGQASNDGMRVASACRKVRLATEGRIVGLCGTSSDMEPFLQWLDDGTKPKLEKNTTTLVLYPEGAIRRYYHDLKFDIEEAPVAIGSGCQFAVTAMDMGASAEKAVAMAAERDIYTGGKITVLHLKGPS